jgi:hypothetical protein
MASLVYHGGALGDFITTLPAIARWREHHHGEPSILLGRPEHAALVAPQFDQTWDFQAAAFAGLFSDSAGVESALAVRLQNVNSALLFAASSSQLPASFARMGVREILRQNPFPSSVVHIVDYHLSLFPEADRAADRIPRVHLTRMKPLEVAALHPGSGSSKKNWPFEHYFALASRLAELRVGIAWVVGPAENNLRLPSSATVWNSLPLSNLAARLAHCRLYVGNDSGVTHLAAAAGCPTVALFGESDPRVWAPRGDRVKVLTSNSRGMHSLSLGEVFAACEEILKGS